MRTDNEYALHIAWTVYKSIHAKWPDLPQPQRNLARRQCEALIREAGIRGQSSGLISEAALQSTIKVRQGKAIRLGERVATEHPITYKVVALHCLERDQPYTFEQYVGIWRDTLITTKTTSDENQMLKKMQTDFQFGDDWKQMYNDAGINLIDMPSFRTKAAKEKYGLL